MQIWKVELIEEAQADFKRLDGRVKKLVLKQLVKLENDPAYGDPLGNKAGINLDGYLKLYVDKKRIRIVYEVLERVIRVLMRLWNGCSPRAYTGCANRLEWERIVA